MEAMLPDNAVESSGGLQAGTVEVLSAVYKVHKAKEYEPRPGQTARKNDPVCALSLKITPISDDGERLEDADIKDLTLSLGSSSLASFHPGKGSSVSDSDPEDEGTEVNAEGNTLFTAGGDVKMNAACGYTRFMKSLQHRGFDGQKIAQCWAPNFVGLKFAYTSVTPDKLEAYGQKAGDPNKQGENITFKVVDKIIALPKGQKPSEAKSNGTAAAAAPPKKAKAAAAQVEDDDDAGAGSAEAEAFRVLTKVVDSLRGKKPKLYDQIKAFWITKYEDPSTKGNMKVKAEARKFIEKEAWLVGKLEDLNCLVDEDEKTVTLPAKDDE
jgi:hypothetical protein